MTTGNLRPLSCHLADASQAAADYFVTGSLVYLATVNLVMPVLAGFVLPIVLTKLSHPGAMPPALIPAEVVPVGPDSAGTQVLIGLINPPGAQNSEPSSVSTGLVAGNQLVLKILDQPAITPMSQKAKSFYSGVAALFGIFSTQKMSPSSASVKDATTGTTASGLSAKDIINIALALISFGAWTWNQVQHAICKNDQP